MKDIQDYLEEAINQGVFNGCCAVVIKQEQVDYYCHGYQQIDPTLEKTTLNTLYDIASLTKVIATTSLTLRLIQEKLLTLKTHIHDIIPTFEHEEITILHLLTHTSGLPADYRWDEGTSKQQIINDICHMKLLFQPSEKVLYSDMGFIILGEVLSKVARAPLDELVKQYVFLPLHIQATFSPSIEIRKKCATTEYDRYTKQYLKGVVHDPKARLLKGVAGHAGVFMNIYDIEKYMQMILKRGKVNRQIFIEEKYIEMMCTSLTPKDEISRGIGYLTKDLRSPFPHMCSSYSMLHTGFTGTSLFIDIENQFAVALLSARVHPTSENNKIIEWRRKFHEKVWECYIKK